MPDWLAITLHTIGLALGLAGTCRLLMVCGIHLTCLISAALTKTDHSFKIPWKLEAIPVVGWTTFALPFWF